jgi:outer membrane protein assembly factor BamD (BamD/ComL family)
MESAPRAVSPTKSPASAPAAPAAPVAAAATRSDLDVELALLQEAQGALRTNDGARALRLLDEHARSFPNGALAEESEAARVFALREVGRTEEARDVAARFLREHPRSPLAPRVARAFETEPSTF